MHSPVNEMAYGPDDARLASPLANLAGLYLSWERWDQAIPLYLRLANLFERLLGADDFHVAMTLDHVAEAYAGQAHYAEAEEFYGRVLAILTPRLGSDNPVVPCPTPARAERCEEELNKEDPRR